MSSKPVSLNLDLETISLLDEAGRREGRSRSAMANRIIVHALAGSAEPGEKVGPGSSRISGDLRDGSTPSGSAVPARGTDLGGFKPDPKP